MECVVSETVKFDGRPGDSLICEEGRDLEALVTLELNDLA